MDLFKTQLNRGAHNLGTTGNWREIQTVNSHNVHYITDVETVKESNGKRNAIIVLSVFLGLVCVGFAAFGFMMRRKMMMMQSNDAKKGAEEYQKP